MISIETLYKNFLDTLENLSTKLLTKSNDDIDYVVHELLPPDVVTYLYEDNVKRLVNAGIVAGCLCREIQVIRSNANKLLLQTWEPSEIRSDKRWIELRTRTDRVLRKLLTSSQTE